MATNSFLSVKEVARQLLPRLMQNLGFPNLIYRDYSGDFVAGKGATVQVKKPVVLTASEFDSGSGITAQNVDDSQTVEVTLDKLATVDVEFGSVSMATDVDSLARIFVEPAAIALAEKINSDGLALYKDIPYYTGTAGTTPDGLDDFALAAKILNDHNVPVSGRNAVWNTAALSKFQQLAALVNAEKAGSTEALRAGSIGNVFGLSNYMLQGVKNHTTGAAGATIAVDLTAGYSAGVSTIHVDGLSSAFVKGDLFTIADDSTQYVVTTPGALSTADQDITFYPPLAKDTADNKVITVVASHAANMVFNPGAFAFVTRPLLAPAGVESYTTSYNGITVRVVRGYNMQYKKEMLSADVLYGYKTMYPEMAAIVLG